MNVIAFILLSAIEGIGQQPQSPRTHRGCNGNAAVVGKCDRVHGRAFGTNGTPNLRIWQIGTDRILGVTGSGTADDGEDAIAPDNLLRALNGSELQEIGEFTRENVLKWLKAWLRADCNGVFWGALDYFEDDDFHAVCGDIDIPWANEDTKRMWDERFPNY
jgi:hypothetical protein